MRLVYKVYPNSEPVLFETDDDGQNPRPVSVEPQPGAALKRLDGYIELNCDNRPDVIARVKDALRDMASYLDSRKTA